MAFLQEPEDASCLLRFFSFPRLRFVRDRERLDLDLRPGLFPDLVNAGFDPM
jgi:hypothetical protein